MDLYLTVFLAAMVVRAGWWVASAVVEGVSALAEAAWDWARAADDDTFRGALFVVLLVVVVGILAVGIVAGVRVEAGR